MAKYKLRPFRLNAMVTSLGRGAPVMAWINGRENRALGRQNAGQGG